MAVPTEPAQPSLQCEVERHFRFVTTGVKQQWFRGLFAWIFLLGGAVPIVIGTAMFFIGQYVYSDFLHDCAVFAAVVGYLDMSFVAPLALLARNRKQLQDALLHPALGVIGRQSQLEAEDRRFLLALAPLASDELYFQRAEYDLQLASYCDRADYLVGPLKKIGLLPGSAALVGLLFPVTTHALLTSQTLWYIVMINAGLIFAVSWCNEPKDRLTRLVTIIDYAIAKRERSDSSA